jgi:hypothetical protein
MNLTFYKKPVCEHQIYRNGQLSVIALPRPTHRGEVRLLIANNPAANGPDANQRPANRIYLAKLDTTYQCPFSFCLLPFKHFSPPQPPPQPPPSPPHPSLPPPLFIYTKSQLEGHLYLLQLFIRGNLFFTFIFKWQNLKNPTLRIANFFALYLLRI